MDFVKTETMELESGSQISEAIILDESAEADDRFDFTEDFSTASCPFSMTNGANDVHKFHILDETDDSDSEKSFSCDSDIPDDEIDRMLEDALEKRKRKADDAGLGIENCLLLVFSLINYLQIMGGSHLKKEIKLS